MGSRFKRYAEVAMASGQKCSGAFDSISIERVISRRDRFFLSATPFCSGV